VVKIILTPGSAARNKELEFYFEELEIKGRAASEILLPNILLNQ
jgi:topoisomerase-4 subunit A